MARKLSSACVNARRNERNVGKFVLSREALDDLDLIWRYIARDNPEAADRVLEAVHRVCEILADHPQLGRVRQFPKRSLPISAHSSLRIFRTTSFFTECFPTASRSCASCTGYGISKKFLTVSDKLQGR